MGKAKPERNRGVHIKSPKSVVMSYSRSFPARLFHTLQKAQGSVWGLPGHGMCCLNGGAWLGTPPFMVMNL